VALEFLVKGSLVKHISLLIFENLLGLDLHHTFLLRINVLKKDNFLESLEIFAICGQLVQLDEPFENVNLFFWKVSHFLNLIFYYIVFQIF